MQIALLAGGLFFTIVVVFFFISQKKLVNKLKNANQENIQLRQQNAILMNEVHHRIKNNLYTISNMLSLHASQTENKEATKAIGEAVNRLISMSLLYERLYQNKIQSGLPLSAYIPDLARQIIDANAAGNIELLVQIDEISLPPKQLSSIGIMLNEIISNSIKHAFSATTNPLISITATRSEDGIEICCRDNGNGITPDIEPQKGFGWELLELSALQLKAKLEIRQDKGTVVKLIIPENMSF